MNEGEVTGQVVPPRDLAPESVTPIAPRRFRREARTLAKIDHPCIVRVYNMFEAKDLFCLVMEYASGGIWRR